MLPGVISRRRGPPKLMRETSGTRPVMTMRGSRVGDVSGSSGVSVSAGSSGSSTGTGSVSKLTICPPGEPPI